MTTWARGDYNAEGSFNYHLHTQLSARTASWFTAWVTAPEESAYLRFDWNADLPIRPPCFAITHLDGAARPIGNALASPTGGYARAVDHASEISIWHSRFNPDGSQRANWQAELRQMRDMVAYVLQSANGIWPLLDFNQSTAAPFTTAGRIQVTDVRGLPSPPDPNPAYERVRLLVGWQHMQTV